MMSRQYSQSIHYRDQSKKLIKLLMNVLITIDDDARYQSLQQRNRIATMFFPVVALLLEASRPDPLSNSEMPAVCPLCQPM